MGEPVRAQQYNPGSYPPFWLGENGMASAVVAGLALPALALAIQVILISDACAHHQKIITAATPFIINEKRAITRQ